MRHQHSRRRGPSPTRRYEIRHKCQSHEAQRCRTCRRWGGYHVESCTGDLDRAKRGVLYLQRRNQARDVYVVDCWTGQHIDCGYNIPIWRSIHGDHKLEAWGDPGYRAPTALEEACGTFSLLIREGVDGQCCRLITAGLPLAYLWILRDAAGGLVEQENAEAFARWAVRQLRNATKENPESVWLLRDKLCSVADWPGALSIGELLSRPAA